MEDPDQSSKNKVGTNQQKSKKKKSVKKKASKKRGTLERTKTDDKHLKKLWDFYKKNGNIIFI